jgi:hypothetical protein
MTMVAVIQAESSGDVAAGQVYIKRFELRGPAGHEYAFDDDAGVPTHGRVILVEGGHAAIGATSNHAPSLMDFIITMSGHNFRYTQQLARKQAHANLVPVSTILRRNIKFWRRARATRR